MTYNLNFVLNLERQNNEVIYNPKQFDEKPIPISTPKVVKIVEVLIEDFETVGLIEDKKENGKSKVNKQEDLEKKIGSSLKSIEGTAYICRVQTLKPEVVSKVCWECLQVLQKAPQSLTPDNFLDENNSLPFSELVELSKFRNYLSRYTRKKVFKKGYFYIFHT